MKTPVPSLRRALALALTTLSLTGPAVRTAAARAVVPPPGHEAAAGGAHQSAMRHYVQGLYLETSGAVAGALGGGGRAFALEPQSPELALKLADLSLQSGNARAGLDYA